jgi:SAM-dependent methyltransferase
MGILSILSDIFVLCAFAALRETSSCRMEFFAFPAVYDIAFQFRNARKVVDFIEWCIATYADIPVHIIVDLACGTGHYTREFARRRYTMYGIDINPDVCQYAQGQSLAERLNLNLFCSDMVDFSLPVRCDLAVSFFDSVTYLPDMHALVAHFQAVSQALVAGGLYIVELGVIDHFGNHDAEEVWTEKRRDCTVTTRYIRDARIHSPTGTFEERCTFRGVCREHTAFFRLKFLKLAIRLEEFDRIVSRAGVFTPLAYYGDFNRKTLLKKNDLPWRVIAVLRNIAKP